MALYRHSHGEEHHDHDHDHHHSATNPSLEQTLDELDFERGLWSSALSGDLDDVTRKVNRDSSAVNKTDNSGYTALHYASRNGHVEVCKVLISRGAKVNIQTHSSLATALHRAAYMGRTQVVTLLLEHGANPEMVDCDGMTALHKAAENGHLETVKLLLKTPSTLEVRDKKGRTPKDIAKTPAVKDALGVNGLS